jgi:hypothetical protein
LDKTGMMKQRADGSINFGKRRPRRAVADHDKAIPATVYLRQVALERGANLAFATVTHHSFAHAPPCRHRKSTHIPLIGRGVEDKKGVLPSLTETPYAPDICAAAQPVLPGQHPLSASTQTAQPLPLRFETRYALARVPFQLVRLT